MNPYMVFAGLGLCLYSARMRGWLGFAARIAGWANRAGYRKGIGRWVV